MGTRLFVGNLSYNVNEQELKEVFQSEQIEVRSVRVAMDRETGRPRGFAFVETETEAGAKQSVEKLAGRLVQGRPLIIEEAQARPAPGAPRPGGPRPPGGGPGGPPRMGAPRPGGPMGPRPGGPIHGPRRSPAQLRTPAAPGPRGLRCAWTGSAARRQDRRAARAAREEEVDPAQARRARARQLALERNHRRRLAGLGAVRRGDVT
jgi:cold-inducible RNA-binding protein